jgi:hypothetical protein
MTTKGGRLSRICAVNFYGNIVLDTLIKPWSKVTDLRQNVTNIGKNDLKHAPSYPKVAPMVSYVFIIFFMQLRRILQDRVVICYKIETNV